jgi:hypothetical protein
MVLMLDSKLCDVFTRSAQFASGYWGGFMGVELKIPVKRIPFVWGVCIPEA